MSVVGAAIAIAVLIYFMRPAPQMPQAVRSARKAATELKARARKVKTAEVSQRLKAAAAQRKQRAPRKSERLVRPRAAPAKQSHAEAAVAAATQLVAAQQQSRAAHPPTGGGMPGAVARQRAKAQGRVAANRNPDLLSNDGSGKMNNIAADQALVATTVCGGLPGTKATDGVLQCWGPSARPQRDDCAGMNASVENCTAPESAIGPKVVSLLFSDSFKDSPISTRRNDAVRNARGLAPATENMYSLLLFGERIHSESHPLAGLANSAGSYAGMCNVAASADMMPEARQTVMCNAGQKYCDLHCRNFGTEGEQFNKQSVAMPGLLKWLVGRAAENPDSHVSVQQSLQSDPLAQQLLIDAVQPRLELVPGCDIENNAPNCRPRIMKNFSGANMTCAILANGGKWLDIYVQCVLDLLLGGPGSNPYHIERLRVSGSPEWARLVQILSSTPSADELADVKLALVLHGLQAVGEMQVKDRHQCIFQAYLPKSSIVGTTRMVCGANASLCEKLANHGDFAKPAGNPFAAQWRHWN